MNMKYSIVIPTYNHCDDLLKPCIDSIMKNTIMEDIELIISANGCKDNTQQYLIELINAFKELNLANNIKVAWNDLPTGYARSSNDGIRLATTDKIILLNNDVLILDQVKNTWIELLHRQFEVDPKCGISGPSKVFSDPAGRDFLIFFCVMIDRKVFETIGLLNEEYGKGGGEDTEFCILAENAGFNLNLCSNQVWDYTHNLYVGAFPIYHRGEGTVHDLSLVPDYDEVFKTNSLKLGKKFNPDWYRWKISNNLERAVYLRGHNVDAREKTRYNWAASNITGHKILDIGCSSGYGAQFFTPDIEYIGLDYDTKIIEEANLQKWLPNANFYFADLNKFETEFKNKRYNTIIAFEVIEHLPNGLALVESLKNHCEHIIISVPYNENTNVFNPHHLLRNLTPANFKDFTLIGFIEMSGAIIQENELIPGLEYSLLMEWKFDINRDLEFLKEQHRDIFSEIVTVNSYDLTKEQVANKNVLDIGANIGVFSLLCACYGAKKVLAIEPVIKTHDILVKNINRLNFNQYIEPLQNVVTDKSDDIVNINLHADMGHNSLYSTSNEFEQIKSITLSDALSKFDDTDIYLKLDCEGAEYDIILNATDKDMARISNIAMEIHGDLHPKYKGFEIIEQKLINFGFKLTNKRQIEEWNYNQAGEIINRQNIPFVIEIWENQRLITPLAINELNWLNNDSTAMFDEIIKNNAYFLDTNNMKNRNVIDIGANNGSFALLANFYGAKKIIAIEPTISTYTRLINNIQKVRHNIIALPVAITDGSTVQVDINLNEDDFNNSQYLIKTDKFQSASTMTLSTLLKFFEPNPNIFLKIDCEGAEFDIILSTEKEDFDKITDIAIEIHLDTHPIYKTELEINKKLKAVGFTLTRVEQMYSYTVSPTGQYTDQTLLPALVQFWTKTI